MEPLDSMAGRLPRAPPIRESPTARDALIVMSGGGGDKKKKRVDWEDGERKRKERGRQQVILISISMEATIYSINYWRPV